MRLRAYCDSKGTIVGLAASVSDDPIPVEVVSVTQPGLRAVLVELPAGIDLDPANPARMNDELSKLAGEFRVDNGTLRKRS